ncbi:hypothetical protein [Streptomyces sp. NPDC006446]|uniref:hypothetical protein n=1 Tax=Streptomyces sp. NPDC006446 TaxID=3154301 RepID=UPI0033A4C7A0
MAHAAPVSGKASTSGSTDVFGAQTHMIAKWAIPVAAGLVYGFWAAAINRDTGAITGWNVLFGFVCAIAFAAAYIGVRALAPMMRRELHAVMWAAFAGCAFGFLYSQTDATVLRSVFMSLAVAVGVFAVAFYRYYTHEDAAGKAS